MTLTAQATEERATAARSMDRPPRGLLGTRWFPAVLGVLVLLGCWSLAALLGGTSRHVIPQPFAVLRTMVADGFYSDNLLTTGWEALRGFVIGNVLALLLAGLCLLLPGAQRTLTRLAAASYCAPAVAIGPVLAVILDPDQAKVIISALSVLFTTMLGAVLGLSSAPNSALELVHVTGGSPLFALLRIRLRAAVPAVLAAIGLSVPAALLGAIVGEYLGGDRGLGVALVQAQLALQVPRTWALALLTTGVAGLAYLVISLLGRRLRFVAVTSELVGTDPTRRTDLGTARRPLAGRLATGAVRSVAIVSGTCLVWWLLLKMLGLDPYLAKTPLDVLRYLFFDAGASAHRAAVGQGLLITLRDAFGGYLVGTVLAVLLAVLMLSSRFAESMFLPVALALRSVPLVAMTPLVALVFGRGLLGVTALATTITVVPTLVNLVAALREVPAPATDLLRAYAVSWPRAMFTVRLYYALPALAMSARVAIPGALLGATLAEFLITGEGLGRLIALSTINSDFQTLWAAVVVVTAVSVVLFGALTWLETTALRRLAG
ncbi:MAG TPA: ABC transporter permease subunit [Pseudonocardia sp.]|jgi:ABC-type nitrate/sulfonate/bicarbonate transport system permease component|uniref:ABC transporter permease n=1 Tax=Pseudonocardia sp. TaxID=60912 RepID=UPI002F4178C8